MIFYRGVQPNETWRRAHQDAHTTHFTACQTAAVYLFNFQWGEMSRDGEDYLATVPYEAGVCRTLSIMSRGKCVATCPVRVVEQFLPVGLHAGREASNGYYCTL